MTYTQQELFDRLVVLEAEKLVLTEDIKQLKKDFSFHKKHNTCGLDKKLVSEVAGAAKLSAKRDYEEKREKALAVFDKYVELTGYDE